MQILKTFFGRRDDGVWAIIALQPIDLKPNEKAESDFYAVQDDIVVTQSPYAGTIKSVMGESIVPVVANVQGENTLRCVGTGFLVSCTGLLITAAHVITDPIDRKYGDVTELADLTWHSKKLNFGVMIPANPLFQRPAYKFFPFEWAAFLAKKCENPLPFTGIDLKLTSDIAICKIPARGDGAPHQSLTAEGNYTGRPMHFLIPGILDLKASQIHCSTLTLAIP